MPEKSPVMLQFTEEMKGYVSLGQYDHQAGHDRGEIDGTPLMVHLTIRIENIEQFIADPAHPAQLIGYIESPLIGGHCPVLKGCFNLFTASGDLNRKTMRYRLFFENSAGQALTLAGIKQIQNNPGPDIWQELCNKPAAPVCAHRSLNPTRGVHTMFPPKFAPALFGFILSGLMSLLVSGISTYRAVGLDAQFPGMWASAWLTAWLSPSIPGRTAAANKHTITSVNRLHRMTTLRWLPFPTTMSTRYSVNIRNTRVSATSTRNTHQGRIGSNVKQ